MRTPHHGTRAMHIISYGSSLSRQSCRAKNSRIATGPLTTGRCQIPTGITIPVQPPSMNRSPSFGILSNVALTRPCDGYGKLMKLEVKKSERA